MSDEERKGREWASAGYKRPNADYLIEFNQSHDFRSIDLKTGPTNGSYYMVYSSDDGENWTNASAKIEANDWDVHTYDLWNGGRYLKLHWFNRGNVDHAAIFYLNVRGDIQTYGMQPPAPIDTGTGYQDVAAGALPGSAGGPVAGPVAGPVTGPMSGPVTGPATGHRPRHKPGPRKPKRTPSPTPSRSPRPRPRR